MVRPSFFTKLGAKRKSNGLLEEGRFAFAKRISGGGNVLKSRSSNERSRSGPGSATSSKAEGEKTFQRLRNLSCSNTLATGLNGGSSKSTHVVEDGPAVGETSINNISTTTSHSHPRTQLNSNDLRLKVTDICQSYQDDDLFSFNNKVVDFTYQNQPTPSTSNRVVQGKPKRLFDISDKLRKSVPQVNPRNLTERRSSLCDLSGPSKSQIIGPTKHLPTSAKQPSHSKNFSRTPTPRATATTTSSATDFNDLGSSYEVDDDVSQLESSIVEEDSPVKVKEIKSRRFNKLHLKAKNFNAVSAPDVASQDSHLSDLISEYSSTQSQSLSSPVPKTPLSIWVRKDQTERVDERAEISEFDSPKRKREEDVHNIFEDPGSGTKSLLDTFKSIKAHYDSSVRLFGHDLRKGKYDENTVMPLLIRSTERQDKLIQTTVYNFKEERHMHILFKPMDMYEIKEGAFLKLYQPWQEVSIPGTSYTMIIAANFYKVVNKRELNLTEDQITKISESPIPHVGKIRVSEPLLMDLVPYNLKNQRTVLKEIHRFNNFLSIEVLVLTCWKETSPIMVLIKDSDDFLSILEIPKTEKGLISTLSPGRYLSLTHIAVGRMIKRTEKLDLFSLLHLFGTKQTYYYVLQWDDESKWKVETLLDLPMVRGWEQLLSIDEIYMVHTQEDHRVSLECRLKGTEADHILVTDDSDMSLNIEFVFDTEKLIPNMSRNINMDLSIKFLRLIHGKAIWDKYTTFTNMD